MAVVVTTFPGLFERGDNILAPEEETMNDESTDLEDGRQSACELSMNVK